MPLPVRRRAGLGEDPSLEPGLDAFLQEMVDAQLMLREGDQLLSLAVSAGAGAPPGETGAAPAF